MICLIKLYYYLVFLELYLSKSCSWINIGGKSLDSIFLSLALGNGYCPRSLIGHAEFLSLTYFLRVVTWNTSFEGLLKESAFSTAESEGRRVILLALDWWTEYFFVLYIFLIAQLATVMHHWHVPFIIFLQMWILCYS